MNLSFTGIQILSPEIFLFMKNEEKFSIINIYMDAAGAGEKIQAFHTDDYFWLDLGKKVNIKEAEHFFKNKI